MATPISRSSTPKQLVAGLNDIIGLSYGSVENEADGLFEVQSSDKFYEEDILMTGFAIAPNKEEGATVFYDTATEGWSARYEHETVAIGFMVTEEQSEDNQYENLMTKLAKSAGRSMAQAEQQKGANVFNNGFSTSFNGGDGQPLFSASHPTVAGGTLSNLGTADLSEAALENDVVAVSLLVDDRGILIGSSATELWIPPQLQFTAERILKSDLRVGTADNDINALKNKGLFPGGYRVNRRFTDPDAYFIKTDVQNGTKKFIRVPLSSKTDGDFDTGNMKMKLRQRYSHGWTDWRQWRASAGV